ncbi:response regulator transcription factor [Desulfosporosinus sp.]|uniref:response regulator transcription factor n=1 Tax=Desulfosporosinus sp. TaxID=157907 RepID=UPI0025C33273|nr:response regulator transcription factor [Desulfosporosinus sp.]MBC2725742.1 response regulator transcription factor [Desulfosporosinus sp.]
MAGETILVVDDDDDIREIITMYLENEGFQVISAFDGTQALAYANSVNPDLIILDMMLPDLDGIEVCQELRKNQSTPIIFLSCKSTPTDKSIGLIAGGDDYMSKPFDAIELLARVKAHLRRNRILESSNSLNTKTQLICYPGLTIDLNRYSVVVNGQNVILSPKEFQLLELLAQNPNTVFSNEQLFKSLWGTDSFGDHRTVMVHISNIRKKLKQDSKNPVFIQTIKGIGYKFCLV